MDPNDPFAATMASPTATRPLLGLTILVVEDSRFACEAIRLLCLRSGARIRRADRMRSARRHLQVYRPSVVIIDLGLPDGNGVDLIRELAETTPPVDAILATSGDTGLREAALAAGANGFLSKPAQSISEFQELILALLPPERRPVGPRVMTDESVHPDKIAYQDDIAQIAELLDDTSDDRMLDYAAQFLSGLARSAGDNLLEDAARALAAKRAIGESALSETAVLASMLQNRLSPKIAL